MTTDTSAKRGPRRTSGARVLLGAGLGGLGVGLVAAAVGALTVGSSAAYGALVGTALVVVVFGLGSTTVNAVSGLLPAASLVVALLTYVLQLLVVLVALSALEGSGAMGETLARGWLGGAVIGGALGWTAVQVLLATRVRIPAYALDADPAGAGAPSATATGAPVAATGGER